MVSGRDEMIRAQRQFEPAGARLRPIELLALLGPWLFAALCILRLSVPTLIWDEWDAFGRFTLEVQSTGLTWDSLWHPHNEHRVVLARLLYYFLCSHNSNPVLLMMLSHIVLGLAYWNLVPLLIKSCSDIMINQRIVFYSAFSAFLFSGVQYENMIFGLQIGWAGVVLGTLLVVRGLVESSRWRLGVGLAVAYFSYAHWLILVPLILGHQGLECWRRRSEAGLGRRLAGLLAMAIGLLGLVSLYLHNLPHPAHHPSRFYGLLHPLAGIRYVALYFGNIFYVPPLPELSAATASILGGLFVLATLWTVGRALGRRERETAWTLWVLVAIAGVGLLIIMGRVGLGIESAVWSRYTTFNLVGWTVLLMSLLRTSQAGGWGKRWQLRMSVLGILSVVALLGLGYLRSQALRFVPARQAAIACLADVVQTPALLPAKRECLIALYPNPEQLADVATRLAAAGRLNLLGSAVGSRGNIRPDLR